MENKWEKQKQWHGNPSLGYDCYMKKFPAPYSGNSRMIPVYVWGKYPDIHYTVSAGTNSDYSYTGSFYPEKPDFEEFMQMVDKKHEKGRLIS